MPMLKVMLKDEEAKQGFIGVLAQVARGNMPHSIRYLMLRGQVLALEKASGDIRPSSSRRCTKGWH
eukprot:12935087-Prorocentrum_lima.AAC.1